MADPSKEFSSHVLVFSFPVQGHINPLLQFSKRLASKGLKITLIIPSSTVRFHLGAVSANVTVAYIPDGSEACAGESETLGVNEKLEQFHTIVSRTLAEFIRKEAGSESPPSFLVYDAVLFGALDVARVQGLNAAPFCAQSCVVSSVYYSVNHGQLDLPVQGTFSLIPSVPPLEESELPTFVTSHIESYKALTSLFLQQLSNLEGAKCLIFNTFFELEADVVKWMRTRLCRPIMTVGPTIPLMYLDHRLEDDKEYGVNFFMTDMEAEVPIKWLDTKEAGSVIYVSFGSLASPTDEQMVELAGALRSLNIPFLWVVRESEKPKLPAGFLDELALSDAGLVVTWCSQLKVLAHKAVGCFITHCGWNSTLEALCLGVPLLTMPQWTDQPTNAKFIEDVWKVGLRVKTDGKGVARRESIEACLKEMMEGEKCKEIRKFCLKWRELAKQAVGEGGSSDKNIDAFVGKLVI